jgi:hypothetical protein
VRISWCVIHDHTPHFEKNHCMTTIIYKSIQIFVVSACKSHFEVRGYLTIILQATHSRSGTHVNHGCCRIWPTLNGWWIIIIYRQNSTKSFKSNGLPH